MYTNLKELLPAVKGISEPIIAVNLDIRGFSRFFLSVDSFSMAEYIRKIYLELINKHFAKTSFIKTTGDGLLIALRYTEENVQALLIETMDSCLKIVQNFDKMFINDPEINFQTPQNIGIGLSRGVACRLVSNNQTMDYSGSVMSVASKLMGVARPAGIVFDDTVDIRLLSAEQRELFEKETIYLAGIAESHPLNIWYTKYFTEILPGWKKPIPASEWKTIEEVLTLKLMKEAASRKNWFSFLLPSTPNKLGMTKVQIEYPAVIEGIKSDAVTRFMDFSSFNYNIQAGKFFVRVNFAELVEKLSEREIGEDWRVTIRIKYQ